MTESSISRGKVCHSLVTEGVSLIDPNLPLDAIATMKTDRNRTHGDPEATLSRIAGMWSAYIGRDISAADVASMMALLKIARSSHAYDRDHYLDGIAYLMLAEGLAR